MRSGVETPDAEFGVEGVGGARLPFEEAGESGFFVVPMVVVRWRFVVSDDGGGGRWCSEAAESMEARHKKHSPVP